MPGWSRPSWSSWVTLAGGALLLAPFTVQGDVYEASDATVWRESLSCPAPVFSLRYRSAAT
jgi:hypothetical protein